MIWWYWLLRERSDVLNTAAIKCYRIYIVPSRIDDVSSITLNSDENPAKALGYRASITLIAAELANNSELAKSTQIAATNRGRSTMNTINEIKRKAKHCALSGEKFKGNCHIHHIEGRSEQPHLVDEPTNLIPLTTKIHQKYHAWVTANNKAITRQTLKEFAKRHGYNSNFTT